MQDENDPVPVSCEVDLPNESERDRCVSAERCDVCVGVILVVGYVVWKSLTLEAPILWPCWRIVLFISDGAPH